ncbi:MAG: DUF4304 domain-containing protein [Mesorhizobium sp.]|nr:DUF4304 domain-containing protein [Mesorhizobium sp.]
MRAVFRKTAEFFAAMAARKARAGEAHGSPSPRAEEPPRDIYLQACDTIASDLTKEGFRYARSGPHLSRRDGDLVFKIQFQSSHNNVAGEYVALWLHGGVSSRRLAEWASTRDWPWDRRQERYRGIAGGQIGNLVDPQAWLEWNLAGPGSRVEIVTDAVSACHEIILPYFDRFSDLDAMARSLIERDVPSFGIQTAIPFLLCYFGKDLAEEAGRNFLVRRPDLLATFGAAREMFGRDGLPRLHPNGYAVFLAAIATAEDLNFAP